MTTAARMRAFLQLPFAMQLTLLIAAVGLPVAWGALRTLGFARASRFASTTLRAPAEASAALRIESDVRAVGIAARHIPFPSSCLTRSIVLCWLLRRHGIAAEIRIGVRLVEGSLDAHAWVESGGVPLNDHPELTRQFLPFGDIPPAAVFH